MKDLKGYLMIIGAACFWGAAATLAKFLLNQQLDAVLLAQARASFSCMVMFVALFLFSRQHLRIRFSDFGRFALLGVAGLAGANLTYYITIRESTVGTAITIQYTAPLFVMAYEVWRKEEKFTTLKLVAAILSLLGCFLAVTGLELSTMRISRLGVFTGIGSIITFSILTIVTRHLLVQYSVLSVTFYSIAFASLFWLFINPPWVVAAQSPDAETWGVLFILAMVSVLIPNLLFSGGLRYIVPSRAVITSTLEPVVAIGTAAVVLGELLSGVQTAGAFLVICAIILLQIRRENAALAEPQPVRE